MVKLKIINSYNVYENIAYISSMVCIYIYFIYIYISPNIIINLQLLLNNKHFNGKDYVIALLEYHIIPGLIPYTLQVHNQNLINKCVNENFNILTCICPSCNLNINANC